MSARGDRAPLHPAEKWDLAVFNVARSILPMDTWLWPAGPPMTADR
jgi:hypothetical protein